MPDPDMKLASLSPPNEDVGNAIESGESVAPKGEVNADNQRAKSPAERLALDDKSRVKSEKCLAEAVYFESRGEAVRGQIAVAQVVMNRVFSGKYPDTVCGVVYQNKYRHFACQFTFACDNNPDVIREPEMWERAKKISKAMLDGQIWLPEVGKSTHYHAYWVRPSWVAEMKKMYKFGVHTFYRPRNWGDGSEEPSWGTPAQTAALSAELAQEAKSSAEMGVVERRYIKVVMPGLVPGIHVLPSVDGRDSPAMTDRLTSQYPARSRNSAPNASARRMRRSRRRSPRLPGSSPM